MKKPLVMVGFFIFLFVGHAFAITTGYWNLDTGLQNGIWRENLDPDGDKYGAHNQDGNRIDATSTDTLKGGHPQWELIGLLLDNPPGAQTSTNPDYTYETPYSDGILKLYDDTLWDTGIEVQVAGINYSRWDGNDDIDFLMELSGQANGLNFYIKALFDGTDTNYGEIIGGDNTPLIHGSPKYIGVEKFLPPYPGDFESLELTITPVPEPTTMLLFGSGLVGLAGFRRRFKKR